MKAKRKRNKYWYSRIGREEWKAIKKAFASSKLSGTYAGKVEDRVLNVSTEYFSAKAWYRKINGVWSCVKADDKIKWLKGMDCGKAKIALLKMGAEINWEIGT